MYISPDVPSLIISEVQGNHKDFQVLKDDKWLMNTEVRYHLKEYKGRWGLTMVYVAIQNPYQLICRKIDSYYSKQRALTFAKILQRGIRKDARGTLKTNRDAFNLCSN
jgi:hypothetical protein